MFHQVVLSVITTAFRTWLQYKHKHSHENILIKKESVCMHSRKANTSKIRAKVPQCIKKLNSNAGFVFKEDV